MGDGISLYFLKSRLSCPYLRIFFQCFQNVYTFPRNKTKLRINVQLKLHSQFQLRIGPIGAVIKVMQILNLNLKLFLRTELYSLFKLSASLNFHDHGTRTLSSAELRKSPAMFALFRISSLHPHWESASKFSVFPSS